MEEEIGKEDSHPECPQGCVTPESVHTPEDRRDNEQAADLFEIGDGEVQFRRQVSAPSSNASPVGAVRNLGFADGLREFAQPIPNHRRHHPPPTFGFKPEPYNGEGDWDEYLVHFETYGTYMEWDERTQAVMLGFCLRGPARSVLAGLSPGQRTDYNVLKEALTQNFSPREQVHLHQAELKIRQRKSGESLTTLG